MARQGVWCREGEGWIVGLGESRTFVRDSKGMAHLAHLLSRPGDETSALDLVAAEEGGPVAAQPDASPPLDATAKAEYRARLESLAAEIAMAERLGDAARSERARGEFEFLSRELKDAIGLGGRDRKSGSSVERARVNVTRSIRAAIERIERQDATLAAHLRTCVRTGAFCVYEPHRDAPVQWNRDPETPPPTPAVPSPSAQGRPVTVMFLDIEDSTALMERLGEEGWLELLALHNDIVRGALSRHGGREVKATGDGFLLTFDGPRQALWCAVDVQRELESHTERDPSRPLRVRIGIHRGEAVRTGDDVLGRTVVVAARISQQASGGQILISDAVRDAAGELGDLHAAPFNVVQLRGLRGLHNVYELAWRPGSGVARPSGAAASSPAPAERLLEREPEMAALRRALTCASEGEGRLVLIEGPAGIGKSSLLLQLLAEAEKSGVRTLRARATRLEADLPFAAARRLFEPALRNLGEAELDRLLSGPVRPAAAMLQQGQQEPHEFSGNSNAGHIANGLFWLAVALADEQPLLLALDDAHWADTQTLEWFEAAAARLADVPVLMLACARGGTESPMNVAAAADAVIAPRPLSADAVSSAVRAVWPEATVTFAAACHATSDGNPFYLREILSAAHAAGIAPDDDGARRLPEATPDSVARAVLARITSLGDAALAAAHALAVFGGRGEIALVGELAELDPASMLATADALDRAEIIEGATAISFAHPLIGAVVERDLRAGRRALLHERAARLLAARQAAPENVAVHLMHARPAGSADAVETLRAAARAAVRDGAPSAAARFLERAVAEPPGEDELPGLLLELGRALHDVGAGAEAVTHLERAMALTSSRRLRAEVLLALSGIHERRDVALRVRQIDALVGELEQEELELRVALEARAIEMIGDLVMETPSLEMTQAHDERLRRVLTEAPQGSPRARQLIAISAVHRAIRATITAEEARALALHALDDGTLTRLLASGAWSADSGIEVLSMADAFDEAERHARAAEREARERGALTAEAWACLVRAMVALHRGALPEAESLLRSVFGIARQLKSSMPPYVEYGAQQIRACSAIERGDLESAVRTAEALSQAAVRPWAAPVVIGRVHAARGDHELAVAALSTAHAMHRSAGIWRTTTLGSPAPDLVHSLVAVGRRDQAIDVASEEMDQARSFGAPSAVAVALRALAHADDPERAAKHLRAAAEVLAPSVALLVRGHVLCDLGYVLRADGEHEQAAHALRQALELSVQCGARRLTERARGELALAGVRPPLVEQTGPQLLSPAERRAAELAAEGADDREIAQALFLSPRVVAEQLAVTIGKLGLSSRAELAQAMQRPTLVA